MTTTFTLLLVCFTFIVWDWFWSTIFFGEMISVRCWRKLFSAPPEPLPTEADYREALTDCLSEPTLATWPPEHRGEITSPTSLQLVVNNDK